jgi:hypothetical protein
VDIPWSVLGGYSLPSLCVVAILLGLLVPKPSVERTERQFQALLDRVEADRDEWKSVALKSMEREARLLQAPFAPPVQSTKDPL